MTLETIFDNLSNGYRQVESGTLRHADQLMTEQVHYVSLRGHQKQGE